MKYRKAVFIVVYSKTKKGIEYLLLKRKLNWNGWEFPKGAIKFLETKKGAIKRELEEETGLYPLKINALKFSGVYLYNKKIKERSKFKGQTFRLYSVEVKKPRGGKIKMSELEHSDYKWVRYTQAIKMLKWKNQKESLKKVKNLLKFSNSYNLKKEK